MKSEDIKIGMFVKIKHPETHKHLHILQKEIRETNNKFKVIGIIKNIIAVESKYALKADYLSIGLINEKFWCFYIKDVEIVQEENFININLDKLMEI